METLFLSRQLDFAFLDENWSNPCFISGKWHWHLDATFLAWLARILNNAVAARRVSPDAISAQDGEELLRHLDRQFWFTVGRREAVAINAIFEHAGPEAVVAAFQTATNPVNLEPIPPHHLNPLAWDWFGLPHRLNETSRPWNEYDRDVERWGPVYHPQELTSPLARPDSAERPDPKARPAAAKGTPSGGSGRRRGGRKTGDAERREEKGLFEGISENSDVPDEGVV